MVQVKAGFMWLPLSIAMKLGLLSLFESRANQYLKVPVPQILRLDSLMNSTDLISEMGMRLLVPMGKK